MNILSLSLGIAAIGFIALIHELGHYLFARRAGIKVEELSLGIGPSIFAFRRGGTDYRFRLIPFMAYVRLGEEGEGSLKESGILPRFFLYLGGAAGNILTAILLLTLIGIFHGYLGEDVLVGETIPGTPAEALLEPGDQILSLNGKVLESPQDFQERLGSWGAREAELMIRRDGQEKALSIRPLQDEASGAYYIGIRFGTQPLSLWNSLGSAMKLTGEYVLGTFQLLGGLLIGASGASDNLVGIVGIVAMSQSFTQQFWDFILFVAVISLGMGIINLMPLPALDGGKILLLILEKARGKKLQEETEARITIIGFALLLALMLFTTINDISRILGG